MKMIASITVRLIPLAGLMLLFSACAVTTEMTEGTTDTLENTTDASTDVTSSTSPGQDDHSQVQKTRAFATVNMDRLREDMARGNGEHLASLSSLLGVSENHRDDFFAFTKEKYPELFPSDTTNPDDLLARLDTELNHHPQWLQ